VKILSIRQPWAHLITQGSKDIENRSWRTKYRGPFLVHASLKVDKEGCRKNGLDPADLPTGGIVGMAEIVDCVEKHRSKWFTGPYGFVLKSRRPLSFVKWTGGLGLKNAPQRLVKRLGI
jgi:ASCH domain